MLKYWICKRAPSHAVECLECLGGNGYVEESGMPRLFRESPLSSIWEGSGNVQCLDVMRAMVKSPAAVEAFFAEVAEGAAAEPRLAAFAERLREEITSDPETLEPRARRVVERMALALQASLLVRYGDEAVADAFCASRLDGDWGRAFGTLPAGVDFARIIERHRPSSDAPAETARSLHSDANVAFGEVAAPAAYHWCHAGRRLDNPLPRPRDPDRGRLVLVHRPLPGDRLALGLLRRRARRVRAPRPQAYALAVASAIGFFGSILLHELGHAFFARRKGIGISSIQLWIFGGVARMERDSDSAGDRVQGRGRRARW